MPVLALSNNSVVIRTRVRGQLEAHFVHSFFSAPVIFRKCRGAVLEIVASFMMDVCALNMTTDLVFAVEHGDVRSIKARGVYC